MNTWRKRGLALVFGAIALVTLDQVLLHTLLSEGQLLGHDLAPFVPPLYGAEQRSLVSKYEEKLAGPVNKFEADSLFDAQLGWCPRPEQRRRQDRFDWSGSRQAHKPLPRERVSGERRIALFGCSYTFGSEVSAKDSWAGQLDTSYPDVHFANLGVPGFGIDQALLRFRRDGLPLEADEVWLGYYPYAALRVTSRFPPLFSRWRAFTINFKPCFELDEEGALRLLPCPVKEPRDILRLLRNPQEFNAAMGDEDMWIRRVPWAFKPKGEHWSHSSALGLIALTAMERGGHDTRQRMLDSDDDVHKLNLAILRTFAREVEASGARFRLLILPSSVEVAEVGRDGEGFWDPIVAQLVDSGIEVHDVARSFHQAGVVHGPKHWMPQGHYSPRGNQLVADSIGAAWLQGSSSPGK